MLNTEYTHKSRVINANTSFIFFFSNFLLLFYNPTPLFNKPRSPLLLLSLSHHSSKFINRQTKQHHSLSFSLSLSYSLPRRSPATCSTEINFRTIIRRPVFLAPTRPSHFKVHSTHISILYF